VIHHVVELTVAGATAAGFYGFMIDPADTRYQEWWPGEHLQFHILKRGEPNHLGDLVYMDEYLGGKRRLKFRARVIVADKPNRIVWQMIKAGVRLPATVELALADTDQGVELRHELRIGFDNPLGRSLDPLIRLYFNSGFQNALTEHCNVEWYRLADYLKS